VKLNKGFLKAQAKFREKNGLVTSVMVMATSSTKFATLVVKRDILV
jgi:hypothetical protein